MSDPFLNLKDNQIEIIVLSYLIKHPNFLDEFFDKLNDKIFYNPEHKKLLHVLNEFSKNSKNYNAISNEASSENRNTILKSFDYLLNDKYKVVINEKTLERVKNYFR